MQKCQVLYVASTSRGGSAFSLYHLVEGLTDGPCEPIVLLYSREQSYVENKLREHGTKLVFLSEQAKEPEPISTEPVAQRDIRARLEARFGAKAGAAYAFLKGGYRFARNEVRRIGPIVGAIRANQVDLVHLNNGLRHGKPGVIAAWLTRTPCVCHVRMIRDLNGFDRIFARFVDRFVYISSAVAESYVAQGVPVNKGTIVHNAVNLEEYSQDYDPTSVRQEFGWTGQEQVVGVVGRLDWWKGHEYYLQAMAEVAQHMPHLRGLIVGEREHSPQNQAYYESLRSLTKSLNLERKVLFTGFRGDVPRLMSAMDVVVLSSSNPEPFGRVVIEGMAARKPVVATAAGGVLDIIEDGRNGLLVPRKDAKAMAKAISWLLSNPARAKEMGLVARQSVEQRFTVQRQVSIMQDLYDAMLRVNRH